jgi:hypothetical protein
MIEREPTIIRMNIAHFEEILKLALNDNQRSDVERLLAKSEKDLQTVTDPEA